MTSAGNIRQTTHIAHIKIDSKKDKPATLKQRIRKTLQMTEELQLASIAIPAIGAGMIARDRQKQETERRE